MLVLGEKCESASNRAEEARDDATDEGLFLNLVLEVVGNVPASDVARLPTHLDCLDKMEDSGMEGLTRRKRVHLGIPD